MLIYLVFYAIGFFIVAVISRWQLLFMVAVPLLAGIFVLGRSGIFGLTAALTPIYFMLWLGVFSGFLGRVIAMTGKFETATTTLGVTFFGVLAVVAVVGIRILINS